MRLASLCLFLLISQMIFVESTSSSAQNPRPARMSNPNTNVPFWAARGKRTNFCDCDGKESILASQEEDSIQGDKSKQTDVPVLWAPKGLPSRIYYSNDAPEPSQMVVNPNKHMDRVNSIKSHWNSFNPMEFTFPNFMLHEWMKQSPKRASDEKPVDSSNTPFWAARG